MRHTTGILALALLCWGCAARSAPPARESPDGRMIGHFWRVAEAREGVVRGDLDAVREVGRWFATHDVGNGLPEGTEPHVDGIRTLGARIAEVVSEDPVEWAR